MTQPEIPQSDGLVNISQVIARTAANPGTRMRTTSVEASVLNWQWRAFVARSDRKIAHPDLHHDPVMKDRPADLACHKVAGDRLEDRGGRGEDSVGEHYDPGDMGDQPRIVAAIGDDHEEGDSRPGAG